MEIWLCSDIDIDKIHIICMTAKFDRKLDVSLLRNLRLLLKKMGILRKTALKLKTSILGVKKNFGIIFRLNLG